MSSKSKIKQFMDAVDADIDKQLEEAEKIGASALDRSMLDKVLRPYAKIMEMQKIADGDPNEFVDATFWLLAVLSVECILNTTDQYNVEQVYAQVNRKVVDYTDILEQMLNKSVKMQKPN